MEDPYVFTEQDVAMLASVLRTSITTKVSIAIMDIFVILLQESFNNLEDSKKCLMKYVLAII